MAFVPILFRDGRVEDLDGRPRRYGHWYGQLGRRDLFPDEFLMLLDRNPRRYGRKRCCSHSCCCDNNNNEIDHQTGNKKPKDGFQVDPNVCQTKPEEISARTTDECVTMEGTEKQSNDENGYVLKHFVHKCQLRKGVDDDKVVSSPSSDEGLVPRRTVSSPNFTVLSETVKQRTIPVIREADSSGIDAKDCWEDTLENLEE